MEQRVGGLGNVGGGAESVFFVVEAFRVIVFLWVDPGNAPGALAPGPDKAGRGATRSSHSIIRFILMQYDV